MADNAGARTARKNKDDLVKDSQAIIKGHENAKKWLTENELVLKNEEPTMSTMASALYQLCSGRFHHPKDMVTGMRAIAMCMEEVIQTRHTTIALDTVKEQVEDISSEGSEGRDRRISRRRTDGDEGNGREDEEPEGKRTKRRRRKDHRKGSTISNETDIRAGTKRRTRRPRRKTSASAPKMK